MKNSLLSAIVLLTSCGLYAQKGDVESCTPSAPIVVDAEFGDWTSEWMVDPKGKFAYNVCNDDANLYLRIRVSDDMTQRKIGLFGLTVYLNPKGKKQGKFGLKYPVEKDMEEMKKKQAEGARPGPAEIEQMKMELVRNEEVLELIGLAKANIVSSRLGLMNGIEVLIRPEEHNYLYEAKIPFKAFHIDKSAVKLLGVTLSTGKLAMPKSNSATPPGGGPGNLAYAPGYGRGSYSRSGPGYSDWNSSTTLHIGVKLK